MLRPTSLTALSSLHLLHVHDLDIAVDTSSTASPFLAFQNVTVELNAMFEKQLKALCLPSYLRIIAVAPASVGKFVNVEWRPAWGSKHWAGG